MKSLSSSPHWCACGAAVLQGFSRIELMMVSVMLGILVALLGPGGTKTANGYTSTLDAARTYSCATTNGMRQMTTITVTSAACG